MSGQPYKTPPKASESKPLGDKIRGLFGRSTGRSTSHATATNYKAPPQDFVFTKDMGKELSVETPLPQRLALMRSLMEKMERQHLEPNALEKVWIAMKDLTEPSVKKEERQMALTFISSLIYGQYRNLGMMRDVFFKFVSRHHVKEDLPYRLQIFKVLSREGKDLKHFENEVGAFLLSWMAEIIGTSCTHEFLLLMVNVLKFNSSFIDEDIMDGYVGHACHIVYNSTSEPDIELCLRVLDSVVCYSYLPRSSLSVFVTCLCQLINVPRFHYSVWNLFRKILGTHIGHSAIYCMCSILQTKRTSVEQSIVVMKGAIAAIGAALWGNRRVSSLKVPAASVLPSFLQGMQNSGYHNPVCNEVLIIVKTLVKASGKELEISSWDLILSIVETTINHIQNEMPMLIAAAQQQSSSKAGGQARYKEPVHPLREALNLLLNDIELIYEEGQLLGAPDRFFSLLGRCTNTRPESSSVNLMTHKASACHPGQINWVNNVADLLDKHFKQESRTSIRLKTLEVLDNVLVTATAEEGLLEKALLPTFAHLDKDKDTQVVIMAIDILTKQALDCCSYRCSDIIQVLKRVLYQASDEKNPNSLQITEKSAAAQALVKIFKVKLFQVPSSFCVDIYEVLVQYLMHSYPPHLYIIQAAPIRRVIMECLLCLRSDGFQRLGLYDNETGKISYSPYMQLSNSVEGFGTTTTYPTSATSSGQTSAASSKTVAGPSSSKSVIGPSSVKSTPSTTKPSLLVYAQAFRCIYLCLDKEMDWSVIRLVLNTLHLLLMNRTLMLSATMEDISLLCTRLCLMLSDTSISLTEKFVNIPEKFTKSMFHGDIFPVLTCFVSYHSLLDKGRQRDLVNCLEFGLVSRIRGRMCVRALTVGALEMQDTMMRLLPAVLLKLSQISATSYNAVPLMEFLSSLIHLPQLYCNFVEEQYMSVFAIALPYTNPFRYNHYTVSLAYHVIAMWFLKCRLSFRKDFVKFIIKGFRANVLSQLEECRERSRLINQDSSTDRFRTQSLDESARSPDTSTNRKSMAAAQAARHRMSNPIGALSQVDENTATFHKELTETCIDMMARYTYSTFTNLPRRSKVSEFLLAGGQTSRWLLGSKIITITTSGGAKVGKAGLCEKCLRQARNITQPQQPDTSVSDPSLAISSGRRRHKSAAVPMLTRSVPLTPMTQDDMHLTRSPVDGLLERRVSMGSQGSGLSEEELLIKPPAVPAATLVAAAAAGGSQAAMAPGTSRGSSSTAGPASPPIRTGSKASTAAAGLNSRSGKIHAIDSVLTRLQASPADKSIFSPNLCNCWCTQWAEIHIRTPTGNLSWMMRIQNDQDLTASFPDFPLDDIAHLFTSGSTVPEISTDGKKIDSTSLGEDEYDSLHEEHFMTTGTKGTKQQQAGQHGEERHVQSDDAFTKAMLESDNDMNALSTQSTGTEEQTSEVVINESDVSLRKTASSPDLAPMDDVVPGTEGSFSSLKQQDSSRNLLDPNKSKLTASQDSRSAECLLPGTSRSENTESPPPAPLSKPSSSSSIDLRRPRGATIASIPEECHKGGLDLSPPPGTLVPQHSNSMTSLPITSAQTSPPTPTDQLVTSPTQSNRASPFFQRQGTSSLSGSGGGGTTTKDPKDIGSVSMTTRFPSPPQGQPGQSSMVAPLRRPQTAPVQGRAATKASSSSTPGTADQTSTHGGINPSFLFLQLYHQHTFGKEHPLPLPTNNDVITRAVNMFDLIFPYETHKIGVLYVGHGQTGQEAAILANACGSVRYTDFVSGIGHLLRLSDAERDGELKDVYVGGLDTSEQADDGQFAYAWHDEFMQVIFHVATLMPTGAKDPQCNQKKRHIGNDYVTIVYNDNDSEYKLGTIKGQFNYVNVTIKPLDGNSNAVTVQTKEEITELIGHTDTKIVSDKNLPQLVRQMAVHANLASTIVQKHKSNPNDLYASNWLERYRAIKRLRAKAEDLLQATMPPSSSSTSTSSPSSYGQPEDFTEYT